MLPWLFTGWRFATPLPFWAPLRIVGVVLIVAGVAALLGSFARFVVEGIGTPAPMAPPQHLVLGGLYRYVRNPIYLALVTAIAGQALLFGRLLLLVYALVVLATTFAFVRIYEEPTLSEKFGAEYEAYRRNVPGWWPRLRPWKPG